MYTILQKWEIRETVIVGIHTFTQYLFLLSGSPWVKCSLMICLQMAVTSFRRSPMVFVESRRTDLQECSSKPLVCWEVACHKMAFRKYVHGKKRGGRLDLMWLMFGLQVNSYFDYIHINCVMLHGCCQLAHWPYSQSLAKLFFILFLKIRYNNGISVLSTPLLLKYFLVVLISCTVEWQYTKRPSIVVVSFQNLYSQSFSGPTPQCFIVWYDMASYQLNRCLYVVN